MGGRDERCKPQRAAAKRFGECSLRTFGVGLFGGADVDAVLAFPVLDHEVADKAHAEAVEEVHVGLAALGYVGFVSGMGLPVAGAVAARPCAVGGEAGQRFAWPCKRATREEETGDKRPARGTLASIRGEVHAVCDGSVDSGPRRGFGPAAVPERS